MHHRSPRGGCDAASPLLFEPRRLAEQPIALDEFAVLLEIEAEPSGSGEGRGWETLAERDGLRLEQRRPALTDERGAELLVVRCSLTLPEVPPAVAVEHLYDLEKRAGWDRRLELLQREELAGLHPSRSGAGPSSEVLRIRTRPLLGILPACEVLQWRALARPAGAFAAWLQRDADLDFEDDEDAGTEEGAWPGGWGLLPSWRPTRVTSVVEGHVVHALVPNCAAMGTRVCSYFQMVLPSMALQAMSGRLVVELARSASDDFRDACLAAVAAGHVAPPAWLPAEADVDCNPRSPRASARRRSSCDPSSPEFFDIASHDGTPVKDAGRCSTPGCDFLGSASSWLVPGAHSSAERRAAAAARPRVLRPSLGDASLTVRVQALAVEPCASAEAAVADCSPERQRRASRVRDRSRDRERHRMASMAQKLNLEMTRSTGTLEAVPEGEHGDAWGPESDLVGGCVARSLPRVAREAETFCHQVPVPVVCEDDPIDEFASALEAAVTEGADPYTSLDEGHVCTHRKLSSLVPPLQLPARDGAWPSCEKPPACRAVCQGEAPPRRFSLPMPAKRRTKRAPPTGARAQHRDSTSDRTSADAVSAEMHHKDANADFSAPASCVPHAAVPGGGDKAYRAGAAWALTRLCTAMPDKAAAQTVAVAAALAAFGPEDNNAEDALGPVVAVLSSLGLERAREELPWEPEPDAEETPRPSPSSSLRRETREKHSTAPSVADAALFCFGGHPVLTVAEAQPKGKVPHGVAPCSVAPRGEAPRGEAPRGDAPHGEPSPGEALRNERRRSKRVARHDKLPI